MGAIWGPTAPDRFHAMLAPLGAPVPFNGWRESVTVQVSRPFAWVVVAHLAHVPLAGRPFTGEKWVRGHPVDVVVPMLPLEGVD